MAVYNDIAFGGGMFVRVGDNGRIESNPDPDAYDNFWTIRGIGLTDLNFYTVVFTDDGFTIAGQDGRIYKTYDLETFFLVDAGTTDDIYGSAYANPVVMLCGENGLLLVSSSMGLSYSPLDSGTTEHLRSIDIYEGNYTAVGDNETIVSGPVTATLLSATVLEQLAVAHALDSTGSFGSEANDSFSLEPSIGQTIYDPVQHEVLVTEHFGLDNDICNELNGGGDTCGVDDSTTDLEPELEESLLFVDERASQVGAGAAPLSLSVSELCLFNSDNLIPNANTGNPVLESFTLLSRLVDLAPTIAEIFSLSPSVTGAYHRLLTDAFTFDEVLAFKHVMNNLVAESIAIDDIVAGNTATILAISETVNLDEVVTANQVAGLLINEAVIFGLLLNEAGEQYDGWVMNTETRRVTRYTNFNFNSLTSCDFGSFATDGSDIYQLTGGDDAGEDIAASITFARMDFGTAFQKYVERIYLGIRADGTMLVKTITDDKIERYYTMTFVADGQHGGRVKLGRGVKSRYWQFKLENMAGSDFELENVEWLPARTKRRIR